MISHIYRIEARLGCRKCLFNYLSREPKPKAKREKRKEEDKLLEAW